VIPFIIAYFLKSGDSLVLYEEAGVDMRMNDHLAQFFQFFFGVLEFF
jgi:hypothetical protein